MDRYVIMVAGGKGLRMGGEVPKQFLPIDGRPVLMRSIDAFLTALPPIRNVQDIPPAHPPSSPHRTPPPPRHPPTPRPPHPPEPPRPRKPDAIGTQIERQFQSGNNWPLGAALSIILIVVTLILVKLYQKLGGDMESLGV